MLGLTYKKYHATTAWHVYRDKKTMTGYLGTIWHTHVPTDGTPEWEMYVNLSDDGIITPIQFANERAVVMFLVCLHDACKYGLVEGYQK